MKKKIDRNKAPIGIEGSEIVEMESLVVTSPLLISLAQRISKFCLKKYYIQVHETK